MKIIQQLFQTEEYECLFKLIKEPSSGITDMFM